MSSFFAQLPAIMGNYGWLIAIGSFLLGLGILLGIRHGKHGKSGKSHWAADEYPEFAATIMVDTTEEDAKARAKLASAAPAKQQAMPVPMPQHTSRVQAKAPVVPSGPVRSASKAVPTVAGALGPLNPASPVVETAASTDSSPATAARLVSENPGS